MDELLNVPEEASLPVFDNPKDGLAFLDKVQEKEIEEMHQEAKRQMAASQEDPTTQNYFMRMDRKTVVQTEKEYQRCLAEKVQMKVIPYTHALQLLKVEDARNRNRLKAKKKKKSARASRKRNR